MSSRNVALSTVYHIFTGPQERTFTFKPPEDKKEMQQDYDRLIHALLIDCEMFSTFLRTVRHIFQLDDTDGKSSYRELPILTKGLKISDTVNVMSMNSYFLALQDIDEEMKKTMLSLLTTTGEALELIRYDMRAFMSLYSFMEKLNDLDNYLAYRFVESDVPVITEAYNIIRVKFPESVLKDALLKYLRVGKEERIQVVEYLASRRRD